MKLKARAKASHRKLSECQIEVRISLRAEEENYLYSGVNFVSRNEGEYSELNAVITFCGLPEWGQVRGLGTLKEQMGCLGNRSCECVELGF